MDLNQANTLKETIVNIVKRKNKKQIKKALDDVSFGAVKGECVALLVTMALVSPPY